MQINSKGYDRDERKLGAHGGVGWNLEMKVLRQGTSISWIHQRKMLIISWCKVMSSLKEGMKVISPVAISH